MQGGQADTKYKLWGQIPVAPALPPPPTHQVPGWGGPSRHRELKTLLAALLPIYAPKQPFPTLGWAQLSQRGQEEKTSYQLQAKRAERPGCSPSPSPTQRYLHCELAPGTSSPAAAHCSHVPLHVEGEVVGAGESPLAEVALEGPVPCVLAVVTGQLVGAGKFPATAFPGAVVRLLTCGGEGVSVGLEVPILPTPSALCSPTQHPSLRGIPDPHP